MISPDVEGISLLRLAIASIAVIGLLGGFAWLLKYIVARGWLSQIKISNNSRIKLVETLPLDARRRMVIVRCDNKEHLLLLGVNQDLVVDSNLPSPQLPENENEK